MSRGSESASRDPGQTEPGATAADSLDQRFAEAMGAALGPDFPSDIALAVSGGGDSMAMLTLAHNWTHHWGVRLWVVTVDHGLRPEAAEEAEMVARECAVLGHPHATLRWHWDGTGNLQDAARRARLSLINRWRGRIAHVLMAHTLDDQAETFLLRLRRGSGAEGLAAMQPVRRADPSGPVAELPDKTLSGARPPRGDGDTPLAIIRPCLGMRRAELRHYLRTLKGQWVDDPSNDDPGYDRVRMRQLIARLEREGALAAPVLARTAYRMARATVALRERAAQVYDGLCPAPELAEKRPGEILFERGAFGRVETDTQLRLLAAALQFVATAEYRPREAPLEALLDRLLGGGGGTLHGCTLRTERDHIAISREYAAVMGITARVADGTLWDGRWNVFRHDLRGMTIRALGEDGWAQRSRTAACAVPFQVARACPAVFDGDRLMACDALGSEPDHPAPQPLAQLHPFGRAEQSFRAFLLSP